MGDRTLKYARIIATGSALPERTVTNADLEKLVETSDEWIRTRTGIRERRVANAEETTGELGYRAALQALERAGVKASELDLIVVGTTTPDIIFPSTACLIQHRLGANGCAAFDVNAACSGFVYALGVADKFIRSGQSKKVLVIGAETLTRMVDWNERETCVLFGDGAGAVVLEASDEPGILATCMHADGGYKELLYNPVGVSAGFKDEPNHGVRIRMSGREVFKVAVKTLDSLVGETLGAVGMDESEIDWLIPHQANLRIIEATAKRLKMSMDRVIVTVDKHANTSSGSVPLALDAAVSSGKVQRGQNLLLEAFGGGFTWASALVRY
ncbi:MULTISPECIES: beta-ketoacyl-ACP synthase III [Oleiagrimonas]|jgi:3-oxoacyl-[acyl-carrier-protein] synthase III|uniref:Beta-ketoacyl-[acyl-carrier-protein] synthase III n=1 Tax=Oleiagrimonas citrea TaxID=1665687 RepID=A0A846ZJE5_9GAMM|nr:MULTISPECIES: beta-ketoacyl-ACP synthase III [Oleiagrimonas]NKZ37689.1 ketoacyl-ACP synthase III [Oleiagrimonas citrea]RAP56380.1 3-oxoacyl-ACP synthase [Oleiagrimonas sp. MCCC 1A03011]